MPGDDFSLVLLACAAFFAAWAWEAWSRHGSPAAIEARRLIPRHVVLTKRFPALLCGFLCVVGVVTLIPWAAALPFSRSGLLSGGILGFLLFVGAHYALSRK